MIEDFNLGVEKLLSYILSYISKQPRTKHQTLQKLNRKATILHIRQKKRAIDAVLDKLITTGTINDKSYIMLWVEDRMHFKPRGSRLLKKELQLRGINKDDIDAYFENNIIEEKQNAIKALQLKYKLKFENSFLFRKKAIQFLIRRGFTYEDARSAFEDFANKE